MSTVTAIHPAVIQSPTLLAFSTEWLTPNVVRISAEGDIDASNAAELARYVFGRAANSRRLVLDLQNVNFFAAEGFLTLRAIDARCADAAVTWMLLPSGAVSRVLQICDPQRNLPAAAAA
jgi:anti-anti-sigma factor